MKSEENIFEEKLVYYFEAEDYLSELPEDIATFLEEQSVTVKMVSYAPLIFNSITQREKE